MTDPAARSLEGRFFAGETFQDLLARPLGNRAMWHSLYKRAALTPDATTRAAALAGPWHMLVLNEPWCGDSVNVLPFLARLKEANPQIHLRMLGRDDNPDLMNSHLTGSSRSIPVVIVLDADFSERGWWGPRPTPLQQWVVREGLALPSIERYRHIRTWYARDQGRTVTSEILSIMEQAAGADEAAAV